MQRSSRALQSGSRCTRIRRRVARTKAPAAWQHLVDGWEARLAGNSDDAEERFAAARSLAAAKGFRYMTADQAARLPKEERLARIEAIPSMATSRIVLRRQQCSAV